MKFIVNDTVRLTKPNYYSNFWQGILTVTGCAGTLVYVKNAGGNKCSFGVSELELVNATQKAASVTPEVSGRFCIICPSLEWTMSDEFTSIDNALIYMNNNSYKFDDDETYMIVEIKREVTQEKKWG